MTLEEAMDAVMAIDEQSGISRNIYAMEECAELTKELTKEMRGKGSREAVIEEACDVLVTTGILLRYYGVSEAEIRERMLAKCNRAVGRYQNSKEV